jgi:DNA-binding NarL/FixJ family response regulator
VVALAQLSGTASPVESLTAKELAVFMKLALGRSVGEVAEDFCLSASTVGTHLYTSSRSCRSITPPNSPWWRCATG